MSAKCRLDLYLVSLGLASSRHQAQQLIRAGKVRDNFGKLLDKPGQLIPSGEDLVVKASPRFVSRGGEKLLGALNAFPIKIQGRICLDAGISTGGFTDCLLQHGAARVYGVDVGYGQVAWTLRNDSRVVLKERTNLRKLMPEQIYGVDHPWPNFAVADLSFISLRLVLPSIKGLIVAESSECILLVKPQFEVGREKVGKGGVVRDPADHLGALQSVISAVEANGWVPRGVIRSPLKGPAGNQEYLLWTSTAGEPLNMSQLEDLVEGSLT
ncbi:TlyA family RNA methyltransferase [Prochlorococcus sp. MIT 1300]|uniref:TlyA family RNA methyltransferase n=1 Tax=Prochlorococcus sp. MIT 1300 TaxID=3096218 RepID=UPI002A7656B3|nr:TlyA family RNA methyltransferase [Prochlorococcus sp. MIT 1300]